MSGINVVNVAGVEINGVRLDVVAKLVDRFAKGLMLAGEAEIEARRIEAEIAGRVHRHREKMIRNGYTKDQILASMKRKMVDEAQRLTGQKKSA